MSTSVPSPTFSADVSVETVDRTPSTSPPIDVKIEMIGCSESGKTVIQLAYAYSLMGQYLGSLMLAAKDALLFNEIMLEIYERLASWQSRANESTLIAKATETIVCRSDDDLINVRFTDPVGQINDRVTKNSDQQLLEQRQNHVDNLHQANVIMVTIPAVPTNRSMSDRLRWQHNITSANNNLLHALRNRTEEAQVSVVVVGTKIDVLGKSADEVRKALPDDALRECFSQLIQTCQRPEVRHAAIIPVSASGFNTMQLYERPPIDAAREPVRQQPKSAREQLLASEPTYVLKADTMPVPYNVDTLFAWALYAGIGPQLFDANNEVVEKIRPVMEELAQRLNAPGAWCVTTKSPSTEK